MIEKIDLKIKQFQREPSGILMNYETYLLLKEELKEKGEDSRYINNYYKNIRIYRSNDLFTTHLIVF